MTEPASTQPTNIPAAITAPVKPEKIDWGYWLNIIITSWPWISGIVIVLNDDIKNHSLLFAQNITHFNKLISYKFDWSTTLFWASFFLWYLAFKKYEKIKHQRSLASVESIRTDYSKQVSEVKTELTVGNDKLLGQWRSENKDLQDQFKLAIEAVRSTIMKAPNYSSFTDATLYLSQIMDVYAKEDLEAIDAEFKKGDHKNSFKMEVALVSINRLSIVLAQNFFNKKNMRLGGNFMIYLEFNDQSKKVIEKLLADDKIKKLYIREGENNKLKGVLYLVPVLMRPTIDLETSQERNVPILLIPIYENNDIYVSDPYKGQEVTIPGATLALKKRHSMISDTLDGKSYYAKLDERTQKEINEFYQSEGKDVRSFTSFSIVRSVLKEEKIYQEIIGIYNIDSSSPNCFGSDETFFETFHMMIYPMLRSVAPYVAGYREYLLKSLAT